jgi:hypothetical protein
MSITDKSAEADFFVAFSRQYKLSTPKTCTYPKILVPLHANLCAIVKTINCDMGKRVFIVLVAALLLVACKNEQNPPEVGGISYNNYFFRLVNSTTQAKFSYSFSSNEEVATEFFVFPGKSEIWHLAKISDLIGIDVSDKIILHLAAYDINTGTRVDLGSKTFFGSDSTDVSVTLRYFLGQYYVTYEPASSTSDDTIN